MLYVCATPIGNLADASPRLLDTLRAAQVIACEDTRHTLKLLSHFGIKGPRLISLHEHNEEARLGEMIELLRSGASVALVTDAGTPTLSDPGFRLVRACRRAGLPVRVLPGPSAVVAALSVSGLPPDRALFAGFLPRSRKDLAALLADTAAARATLVAFESPRRLRGTLRALAELVPEAELALCRELTKMHEEVLFGRPAEVEQALGEQVRGEIVMVLALAPQVARSGLVGLAPASRRPRLQPGLPDVPLDAPALVQVLLQEGLNTKTIADIIARLSGMTRREAYALVVSRKPGKEA